MAIFKILGFYFTYLLTLSSGAEICCPHIGCFTDQSPWDHVPVPQCSDTISVQITMFNRGDSYYGEEVTRNSPIPSGFNRNRRSVFLVHGWMHSSIIVDWVETMRDQLLQKEDLNVFIVDWDSVDLWYPQSVADTRVVGADIAWLAGQLNSAGQSTSNMWCIGHSLGGHVCGQAGKRRKLGRITGLDPAGPLWEGYSSRNHLRSSDADFVDVIHTHTAPAVIAPLGFAAPLGDVDFYPNGGGLMPGCILDPLKQSTPDTNDDLTPACSHFRAVDFMWESINSGCSFRSISRCSDYQNIPGSCSSCRGCQELGFNSDRQSGRGLFYLTTNSAYPYCQG